jgi:spore maturation protein CgeB
MRILLVGNLAPYHVGAFLRRALRDRGLPHDAVDIGPFMPPYGRPFLIRAAARLSGWRRWRRACLNRAVRLRARTFRPDVVLVTGGLFMTRRALDRIRRETGAVLVNWALDDPFNPRHRTRAALAAIPAWDAIATPRRSVIPDLERAGCRRSAHVRCAYEPSLHFPEAPAAAAGRFEADVVFVGGADADRFSLLRAVAAAGHRLHLYGGFWERDKQLRPHHRGFALGADYRMAIGGAKVALGLVRRANRDGHVMRSYEIPACGGFMLADRTDEHREMLEEDREAVFFASDAELLDKLSFWLPRESERRRIAEAGRRRVVEGGHTYARRLDELLALAAAGR